MSGKDVFQQQEERMQRIKNLNVDVFGNKVTKLPCDNMASFKIEDCKTCPSKCPEPEE